LSHKIECSVIISIYKNLKALSIILDGYERQTFKHFEIILAEDKEGQDVLDFVTEARKKYSFPIIHVHHADNGFLKCKILNQSIAASTSDYLIFTDGDCVPHHKFVAQHVASRIAKTALFGRRVMLSESFTNKVYQNPNLLFKTSLHFNLWKYKCQELIASLYIPWLKPKNKTGIWGCNWAVHKSDMLQINGFDEDYTLPGYGEDRDIEWRLQRSGVLSKQIKHRVIQYHLWHAVNYTDTMQMKQLMIAKMKNAPVIPPRANDAQLRVMEHLFDC
jgi:glycosyltransferase involved in cell wall biosynthesis